MNRIRQVIMVNTEQKKWGEAEAALLMQGIKKHGVGNWRPIKTELLPNVRVKINFKCIPAILTISSARAYFHHEIIYTIKQLPLNCAAISFHVHLIICI